MKIVKKEKVVFEVEVIEDGTYKTRYEESYKIFGEDTEFHVSEKNYKKFLPGEEIPDEVIPELEV